MNIQPSRPEPRKNDLPSDYERLVPYFGLIRQIDSILAVGALQWVEVGIFIDQEKQPRLWTEIERHFLCPKRRSIEITESE